ncbi:hypothetical protein [Pseudonocardia humida]|uniref:Uncharacterized protein n=1 Tax=Pseudonocardia humida TaxID=2800819 RepID=A0ABT1AB36_9PSEU|nr:hypothetical protein [Pseudonocardia humida]MCO1660252.1 hypothetical protein [Pseudonocardia humida]
MSRRPPGRVRADAPLRRDQGDGLLRGEAPDWLSARGALALARLHRDQPRPYGLRTALRSWEHLLRNPFHRLIEPGSGCGHPQCCPEVTRLRAYLLSVAAVLPPRDARHLRRLVADLESRW